MRLTTKIRRNLRTSKSSVPHYKGGGFKTMMLSQGKQQCSTALQNLIGCFKTKNPVDIEEALDVFK